MKLNEITKVTKENFNEVEKVFCKYERRYNKERISWRVGSAAGDIAFGPLFIVALSVLQKRFPSRGGLQLLGSVAAMVLGSFLVFLLAATAARIAHRDKVAAPTKGSDLERAEALLKRAEAVCNGIPKSLLSYVGLGLSFILFLFFIIWAWFDTIGKDGIIVGGIFGALAFLIIIGIVMFLYGCYSALCRISYKTLDGEPGLLQALESYVRDFQTDERIEQDRLRGDKLYIQATSSHPVDEKLMAEAAKLRNRYACLYMGRKMMREWTAGRIDGIYTQGEMEQMAMAGRDYFLFLKVGEDYSEPLRNEVELGWLVFNAVTEYVNDSILRSLRELRRSEKLSKDQEYICDDAIRIAVNKLDGRAAVLKPSLESVIARMEAMEAASGSSSSSSWNTMNDDLDIIMDSRLLGDDSWRDAE